MNPKRVKAYNRLKDEIENAILKKEFANKKEILLQLAAVCTGMCEDPATCNEQCPLHCKNSFKDTDKS